MSSSWKLISFCLQAILLTACLGGILLGLIELNDSDWVRQFLED